MDGGGGARSLTALSYELRAARRMLGSATAGLLQEGCIENGGRGVAVALASASVRACAS